MFENSLKDIYL